MSLNAWMRVGPRARVAALMLTLALVGCASQAPLSPGFSKAEVRQRWGEPTSRHVLPQGGTRWEYAQGPEGAVTYMVDFDGNERLATVGQVLTEVTFSTIAAGQTAEAVRRTIGRPSNVASAGLRGGLIWSYRYETTFCQWFQVVFDADRRVRETGFGNDPRCFPKNDGKFHASHTVRSECPAPSLASCGARLPGFDLDDARSASAGFVGV